MTWVYMQMPKTWWLEVAFALQDYIDFRIVYTIRRWLSKTLWWFGYWFVNLDKLHNSLSGYIKGVETVQNLTEL